MGGHQTYVLEPPTPHPHPRPPGRTAHYNLAKLRDVYLHTNTLAALANLAPHMSGGAAAWAGGTFVAVPRSVDAARALPLQSARPSL